MTTVQPEAAPKKQHYTGWTLLKNVASSFTGTVVVSLIGFLLTPFLVHQLGHDRFGAWILIFSLVSFTELADFGIGQGVQRFTAQYVAQHQTDKIKSLAGQAYTLVTLTMALFCIPLLVVDLLAPLLFQIPSGILDETQWGMGLLIFSMLIYLPLTVFSGIIVGYHKYDWLNLNWIGFSVVRALTLLGCAFLPNPLMAMAGGLVVLAALRLISMVWLVKRLCPDFEFGFQWPDPAFFKQVAHYGSSLFAISILGRIIYTSDTLVLGLLLPASAITFYAIGAKWSEIFRQMLSASVQVCFPAFSHFNALDDQKRIRDILLNGSRSALGLGILGASLMILLASPLILLWVGPGFEQSVTLMRWMGLVGVVISVSFPFEHYLKAVNHLKPLFGSALCNCIFNIIASVFLIQSVGLVGAVWGTLAPLVPTAFILVIPAACRHAGISPGKILKHLLAPLILPVIWVFSLGVWFHFYPPRMTTIAHLLYWGALITSGYVILWMLFDPIPRRVFRSLRLAKAKQSSETV